MSVIPGAMPPTPVPPRSPCCYWGSQPVCRRSWCSPPFRCGCARRVFPGDHRLQPAWPTPSNGWSPMLDQWRLPWIGSLGRRRSWLVLSQALIAVGLIGMALCNPQHNLTMLIALAGGGVLIGHSGHRHRCLPPGDRRGQAAGDPCRQLHDRLPHRHAAGQRRCPVLAEWLGSSNLNYDQAAWTTTPSLCPAHRARPGPSAW